MVNRRNLIKTMLACGALELAGAKASFPSGDQSQPAPAGSAESQAFSFSTDASALHARYNAALAGLKKNITRVHRFDQSVLIEGNLYGGIWLEDGPQEALLYAPLNREVGAAGHNIFFQLQRSDGYLPCYVRFNWVGSSQIQMVVPIAATALELFALTQDEQFLTQAYRSCAAWDDWLVRYRNTRGTGLCEVFCGYDTGQDNSPRFKGIPWACPQGDARQCPHVPGMPRLAPDLSATVYGGRVALAGMATILGKPAEAARWMEKADAIRSAIMKWCFDSGDLCFYDRDTENRFVKVRSVALLRVLGEHVVDDKLFEAIYRKHVHNPREFWTPYPFPSIAADDPLFDHSLPRNSWGGASQTLTALRAPRWMEHYGKPADLTHLMSQWVQALTGGGEFQQQANPWTGALSTGTGYSPAMLLLIEFVSRLYGIRKERNRLDWNCRLPQGAATSRFILQTSAGEAELVTRQDRKGSLQDDPEVRSELSISGRKCGEITGEARLETDLRGVPQTIVGTASQAQSITLRLPHRKESTLAIAPDQRITLESS